MTTKLLGNEVKAMRKGYAMRLHRTTILAVLALLFLPVGASLGAAHTETKNEPPLLTSGVDGPTYSSPIYGYYLAWDAGEWDVAEVEEYGSGEDALMLTNQRGASLSIETHGMEVDDPAECIADEWDPVYGSYRVMNVQRALDSDGTLLAGKTDAGAYGVFSFERRGDHGESLGPGMAYTECRMFDDTTVMVMTFRTMSPETYNEDIRAAFAILETIAYQGAPSPMPLMVPVDDVLVPEG